MKLILTLLLMSTYSFAVDCSLDPFNAACESLNTDARTTATLLCADNTTFATQPDAQVTACDAHGGVVAYIEDGAVITNGSNTNNLAAGVSASASAATGAASTAAGIGTVSTITLGDILFNLPDFSGDGGAPWIAPVQFINGGWSGWTSWTPASCTTTKRTIPKNEMYPKPQVNIPVRHRLTARRWGGE